MDNLVENGSALFPVTNKPELLRDLPTDWLIQVLDCLSTRELFIIMRTSRGWNRVCTYLIKYRKALIVVGKDDSGPKFFSSPDIHTIQFGRTMTNEEVTAMFTSLKQMRNLERFEVSSWSGTIQAETMALNSATLREAVVDHMPQEKSLVFPGLKKLSCLSFPASNAGERFPVMEGLTLRKDIDGVISLQSVMPKPQNPDLHQLPA